MAVSFTTHFPFPVAGTAAGALPLFTPDRGPPSGLDMLAAAALLPPAILPATLPGLHSPGPYNPGATVSTTVATKILSLKFIEMCEVGFNPSAPTGRPRLAISDISVWVERFATMAAIMAQRFPEKAPELFRPHCPMRAKLPTGPVGRIRPCLPA